MKHFKFLVFFCVFLFLNTPSLDAKEENSLQLQLTEISQLQNVEDMIGDFMLLKEEEGLVLIKKETFHIAIPADLSSVSLHIHPINGVFVFGLFEEYLMGFHVSNQGIIVSQEYLLDFPIVKNFEVHISDSIFLFGSCLFEDAIQTRLSVKSPVKGNLDVFLAQFELDLSHKSIHFYGGEQDEVFLGVQRTSDSFFMILSKDGISPGDFGNGGIFPNNNLGIVKLDTFGNIKDYIIVQSQIHNFASLFVDEEVFLFYDDKVLSFSFDLKLSEYVKLQDYTKRVFLGPNHEWFLITDSFEYKVYSNTFEESREYGGTEVLFDSLFLIGEGIVLRKNNTYYALDMFYLRNTQDISCSIIYCYEYKIATLVTDVFANFTMQADYTILQKNTHGTYILEELVMLSSGSNVTYQKELHILPERNIFEGGMYPMGYRLRFSGRAFIGEEELTNNAPLHYTGDIVIKFLGHQNTVEEIWITLQQIQHHFVEEEILFWDVGLQKPDNHFYFDFDIKNGVLHKLQINGIEYAIMKEEGLRHWIELTLDTSRNSMLLELEKITYQIGEVEYTQLLHQTIVLKIFRYSPQVEVFVQSGKEVNIQIQISDVDNTVRGLMIDTPFIESYQKEYLQYRFDIFVHAESTNSGWISLYLMYDIGKKEMCYIKLFDLQLHEAQGRVHIGKVEVIQKTQTYEQLNIQLPKTALHNFSAISVGPNTFELEDAQHTLYILIGVGVFMICAPIAYGIKKIYKQKRLL